MSAVCNAHKLSAIHVHEHLDFLQHEFPCPLSHSDLHHILQAYVRRLLGNHCDVCYDDDVPLLSSRLVPLSALFESFVSCRCCICTRVELPHAIRSPCRYFFVWNLRPQSKIEREEEGTEEEEIEYEKRVVMKE